MLKFVVVLYRRPDLSREAFFANLRDEHGPMAEKIPGLRRYVQNHVLPDPKRNHPGWDAVIELYWDDRVSMEAAWQTPEGQAATKHSKRSRISLAAPGRLWRSTSAVESAEYEVHATLL